MPYLRMLCLRNNVRLEGKYEHIPKALRWLEWHPEDLDSLPDSLHLENIVVLDLSDSSITQLWNSPQRYTRIKVLCLSYCRNLSICPDFGGMPMLEKLDLKYCDKITQLDPSIRQLKDLRHLSLRNCHSLKELPEGFWQSTSLEMLDLTECYQITNLPHQWKDSKLFNLGRLEVLKFIRCENLTMCPDFTSMPHLNTLEFDGCRKMTELHPSIGHLGSLTLLSLRSCHSLKELPEEFWQLTSLEKLDLTDCVQITTFPSNLGSSVSLNPFTLGNLKVLYLSWCESLTICPDFTSMPHLETLFFDGCQNMSELHPSIGCLKNLVQLSLRECESLQELPQEVCQLTSLQKLDLNYCTQIATLTMSSSSKKVPERILSLPNLEEISDCDCSASSPNSLGNLKNLRQLDLSGTAIEELPDSVMSLDKLEVLLVAGCDRLKFLPASASTGSILRSHEKPSASTVGGYSERQQHSGFPRFPPSLITLDATGCYELEMIADVSKAKGLQKLDLRGCKKLADVPGIEQLKMLKSLKLGGCRSVSNSLGKGFKSKQSTLD